MKRATHIPLKLWDLFLRDRADEYKIYVPARKNDFIDYELIEGLAPSSIVYNKPKPASPLKLFFLPVRENVTRKPPDAIPQQVIVGTPACDLAALGILDEMYLKPPYIDPYYQARRERTILIGTDCHDVLEHCHCTTYGVKPYPTRHYDVSLSVIEEEAHLVVNTDKGEAFLEGVNDFAEPAEIDEVEMELIQSKRRVTESRLKQQNAGLPNYKETGELIEQSDDAIWKKYSRDCVSCGACTAICPTCTCFLLVDLPGFNKVRQLDACQYPGFARIAAGEDHLRELPERFKNRYKCKYVWKPEKFESIACTGCGRCIETCIGNINKNELFKELASEVEA